MTQIFKAVVLPVYCHRDGPISKDLISFSLERNTADLVEFFLMQPHCYLVAAAISY